MKKGKGKNRVSGQDSGRSCAFALEPWGKSLSTMSQFPLLYGGGAAGSDSSWSQEGGKEAWGGLGRSRPRGGV